jgi:probable F420-dependent oxidoreductase
MKLGFQLPQYGTFAGPAVIRRMALAIEERGFDSVWCGDHLVIPRPYEDRFSRVFYEVFTTLAFTAGFTERVRLGMSVLLLPYRPAATLAKTIASLDALSGGRTIVGVAPGWMEEEFAALGVPFAGRGRRFDATLAAMRRWWTEDDVEGAVCEPRPVQRPHPPLWIGGNGPRSRRRAAHADGWHPITSVRVGITLAELVAGIVQVHALAERAGRDPTAISMSLRAPLSFEERSRDEALTFMAPVESVRARLEACRDAGVEHVVFDLFYSVPGGVLQGDVDGFLRTIDRFASAIGSEI